MSPDNYRSARTVNDRDASAADTVTVPHPLAVSVGGAHLLMGTVLGDSPVAEGHDVADLVEPRCFPGYPPK